MTKSKLSFGQEKHGLLDSASFMASIVTVLFIAGAMLVAAALPVYFKVNVVEAPTEAAQAA